MISRLWTPRQVAERLQVSLDTVYALLRTKRLRSCRVGEGRGKLHRIPEEAIQEYLTTPPPGTATRPQADRALPVDRLGIAEADAVFQRRRAV